MLKKTLLSLLLLLALSPTIVYAAPTEKLTVSTYCELYMQRLDYFQQKYDFDLGITVYESIKPMPVNGGIAINSTSGSIIVDPSDMSVIDILMTANEVGAPNDTNTKNERIFIAALSALEFDYIDDNTFKMNEIAGKTPANSIEAAYNIFRDNITPAFNNENLSKANAGEKVLIYSGNYDYYLLYQATTKTDGTSVEYYYIDAVAR